MSEVKVNKLSPRSGTTVTIGDSGDTINIVGTLQNNGSALTGDISSVVAGTGLSGGGTSGDVTLNVEAAQSGITSLGTLTALNVAGNATITTTDNSDTLKLVSTDADASRGPVLVLHRDSGSPADNDVVGELQFAADSDAASETNFALFIGTALDVSHGSESGQLDIQTRLAGTGRSRIKMNSTETIINDDSVNLDFRVESDANANMFFVNAGNSRIGIGTSGPSADLDIVTSADATNFRIENTTHNTIMDIVATTANKNSLIRFSDNDGSPGVLDYDHNDNSMKFTTNGSERIRILSGGGITFNGDTATANALNDYEEGTWTPSYAGSTSGSISYGSRGGTYTKVGNLVTAWFSLVNFSTSGSWAGDVKVTGLPFTCNQTNNVRVSTGNCRFYNINTPSNTRFQVSMDVDINNTHLIFLQSGDDTSWESWQVETTSSSYLEGTITYRTDS